MHISRKTLVPTVAQQIEDQCIVVINDLKKKSETATFFHDFFTPAEQVVLSKRLAIAVMLQAGRSYQEIKQILQVSSATISFVAERLNQPGFQTALEKIQDDQWAENIFNQFGHFLRK